MHTPVTSSALPDELCVERRGNVLIVRLARPAKRNALNDATVEAIDRVFSSVPDDVHAIVLHGEGAHFSAGLDLAELTERDAVQGLMHSRMWHRALDRVQFGKAPVIAALHGAVIGGGLELACAAHIRVAEPSAYYALPEGQRGIFVGGGASVRVAKIIGPDRMTEMMLTGRSYSAEEGLRLGLSHYLVPEGQALEEAFRLARQIATNAPLSNWASITAVANIADMSMANGLYTESLAAAIAQSSDEANRRMQDFLNQKKG